MGVELAEIELSPRRMEGEVIVLENGEPLGVSYQVDCDDGAVTLRASVRLKRRGGAREPRQAARSRRSFAHLEERPQGDVNSKALAVASALSFKFQRVA